MIPLTGTRNDGREQGVVGVGEDRGFGFGQVIVEVVLLCSLSGASQFCDIGKKPWGVLE